MQEDHREAQLVPHDIFTSASLQNKGFHGELRNATRDGYLGVESSVFGRLPSVTTLKAHKRNVSRKQPYSNWRKTHLVQHSPLHEGLSTSLHLVVSAASPSVSIPCLKPRVIVGGLASDHSPQVSGSHRLHLSNM